MLRFILNQGLQYSSLFAQWKFDPTITISGLMSVLCFIGLGLGAWFALNYRVKDLNDLKPAIQAIPLIQHDVAGIKDDMKELKGCLAVIPTLVAALNAQEKNLDEVKRLHELDMGELKRRLESLEKSKMGT